MQVHFAHDQAVAIRIADERRRIVPSDEVDAIIAVAFFARHCRLEKSFGAEPVGHEALIVSVDHYANFLGVRTKDADNEIFADAMRSKNAEWIGVRAGEKQIQLVDRHTGYFEGTHGAAINLRASAQNVARRFPGGCIRYR